MKYRCRCCVPFPGLTQKSLPCNPVLSPLFSTNWPTDINTQDDLESHLLKMAEERYSPPQPTSIWDFICENNSYCSKPLRFTSFSFTTARVTVIKTEIIFFCTYAILIDGLLIFALSLSFSLFNQKLGQHNI